MDLDTPSGDGPQGPQKSGASTVPGKGSSEPDQRDGGPAQASGDKGKAPAASASNLTASGDTGKATAASAATNVCGDKTRAKALATSKIIVSCDKGEATATPASNFNPLSDPASAGVPDRVNSKAKKLRKETAVTEQMERSESIKRVPGATTFLKKFNDAQTSLSLPW